MLNWETYTKQLLLSLPLKFNLYPRRCKEKSHNVYQYIGHNKLLPLFEFSVGDYEPYVNGTKVSEGLNHYIAMFRCTIKDYIKDRWRIRKNKMLYTRGFITSPIVLLSALPFGSYIKDNIIHMTYDGTYRKWVTTRYLNSTAIKYGTEFYIIDGNWRQRDKLAKWLVRAYPDKLLRLNRWVFQSI